MALSRKIDGSVVWPTWRQIKIATILEPSRTRRTYSRLFDRPDSFLPTVYGRLLAVTLPSISEEDCWRRSDHDLPKNFSVNVTGMENFFIPLLPYVDFIRPMFADLIEHKVVEIPGRIKEGIVMHIRLGDFIDRPASPILGNCILRPSYYRSALRLCNEMYGTLPLTIVSDGNRSELASRGYYFDQKDCAVLDSNDPLTDLSLLVNARIRIASASTFSMWSSFLSGRTTFRANGAFWKETGNSNETEVSQVDR